MSCWPDIEVHKRLHDEDDVLILACDGVWDVLSSEAAVDLVRDIHAAGEHDVSLVAEELIDIALEKGTELYGCMKAITNMCWYFRIAG